LISFSQDDQIILDNDIKELIPEIENSLGNSPILNCHIFKGFEMVDTEKYFREQNIAEKQKNTKKENSMFLAGQYLRDLMKKNINIRLFSPDETYSNRLQSVFETTKRQ
jgi:xylulose-5-phosphate/fructose-6-phosphate phosphoketolase